MSKTSEKLKVHKFCSKLRHKIEDNLAHKLGKNNRHSHSMSSLYGVGDSTTGKYINKSKESKARTLKSNDIQPNKITETIQISSTEYTGIYVDSDDEYQLPSLSLTKQSLEDEIFAELEKAAHDEQKLNTVLKTFDRILTDFHEEPKTPIQQPIVKAIENTPRDLIKSRSNLCELSGSKIPVWKAKPLGKRSNSFCQIVEPTIIPKKSGGLRHRAVSYTTLPQKTQIPAQQKQKQQQPAPKQPQYRQQKTEKAKLVKSKTELQVKTKLQNRNRNIPSESKPGNLRRAHTNSDELLDKCMEKGQQILAKIESLGTQSAKLHTAANVMHNTVKRAVIPDETETKYLAQKGRQNSDALSDDSGHMSNEADPNTDSLSDVQINNANTPARSLKITELLQKFEKSSNKNNQPPKQQQQQQQQQQQHQQHAIKPRICTSIKLAEVEAVHCVQTHIEIFPNYSKEVTTWFY